MTTLPNPRDSKRSYDTEFPNPHGTHHNEAGLADFRKSGEEMVRHSREIATVVRVGLMIVSPSARKDAAAEMLPFIQAQADIFSTLAAYLREVQ